MPDNADINQTPNNQEIKDEFNNIIRSKFFRRSPNAQELLELFVNYHCNGERLSGEDAAMSAFYRGPRKLGALRVLKRDLVKRLKAYYETEGKDAAFTLVVPTGAFAIEIGPPPEIETVAPPEIGENRNGGEPKLKLKPNYKMVAVTLGICVLLVAGLAIWLLPFRITSPSDGASIPANNNGRAIISVKGTGGYFSDYHYLLVEPIGGGRFVQQCRNFPVHLSGWFCDTVFLGDATTPSGTKFHVYVYETSQPLKDTDFDLESGRLSETFSKNSPPERITISIIRGGTP